MPGENLPRQVWYRQIKFPYKHWLAALVKGKCLSTKPTCLATGVVCHPDTEQNRPYKIPWSFRGIELHRTITMGWYGVHHVHYFTVCPIIQ